jgi:hypothetical protein
MRLCSNVMVLEMEIKRFTTTVMAVAGPRLVTKVVAQQ